MEDTEMKEATEEGEAVASIALDVFQFVKIAQSQHGLKHNDYARYRQYCKNKLHRSRRHLKLQQGKGKFAKRKLEVAGILSTAHLQVPLVNAEKSWAHAMESKGQLEGEHAAQVRQNVLRRLNKAAKHASEFAFFAQKRGTTRTALEAEAYAEHLNGLALLEHPTRRFQALKHLQKAKKLCEQLATIGSFEQQAVAQQRLDEIEPLARFAQYQLSQGTQEAPPTPTTPSLGGKFAELKSETRGDASILGNSTGPAYLRWRGNTYAAFGERLKAHVNTAEQAAPDLKGSESSEHEIAHLETVSNALNEAKSIVRHSLATSGGSGADSADALEDLKALNTAISGKQLETTIQRNKLLALQAQKSLDNKSQPQVIEQTKRKGRKAKGQGPATLVRQYDTLIQNLKELSEVAGHLGGASGEYLLDDCTALTAEMRARRCFWVARTYLSDQKPKEACALFGLASERSSQAVNALEDCAKPDPVTLKDLDNFKALCTAWKIVAHANALEAEERLNQFFENIDLESNVQGVQDKYLLDDLESWKSYAGNESKPARIAPIPPRLQLLQAKPFSLNCALDYIQPPNLAHRIPKQEKKSTIGRLFGWGTK